MWWGMSYEEYLVELDREEYLEAKEQYLEEQADIDYYESRYEDE